MKKNSVLALFLCAALALSGCSTGSSTQGSSSAGQEQESTGQSDTGTTASGTSSAGESGVVDGSTLFSDRDREIGYDAENSPVITLTGDSGTCDSDAVQIQGSTITITDEGTYLLQGTLEEGMVVVDAGEDDKVQLVLEGVTISNSISAPLYLLEADKVFLTTGAGDTNLLTHNGEYEAIDDNNIDGVIFSKCDLTLNGAGTLEIQCDTGHGVVSKDDLVITSGSYVIEAAGHGLSGKDSVAIGGGDFTLTTGKDGVQSENDEDSEKGYLYVGDGTFTVTAQGDAFSASSCLQIDGGNYDILTGGGYTNGETHTDSFAQGGRGQRGGFQGEAAAETQENPEGTDSQQSAQTEETASTKGIKAVSLLTVQGGSFLMDCADDAFHSNGDLVWIDGEAQIQTGDDAFHADDGLTVKGGTIDVTQSYEGLEGMTVTVEGGDISLVCSDDGINAASGNDQSGMGWDDRFSASQGGMITVLDGTIWVDAGGDGLDSNGDILIQGGTLTVSGSATGGDSTLDYDGSAQITGGIFLGTGMSAMAQNFSQDSTQGAVLTNVGTQSAGSTLSITDSQGNTLASWEVPKDYDSLLFSFPELEVGETYTISTGSATTTVTPESLIEGSGMGGGMGGGKGQRPGQRPGSEGGGTPPEMPDGEMPDGETPLQRPQGEPGQGQTPPEGLTGEETPNADSQEASLS